MFLKALPEQAYQKRARWDVVLKADAAQANSTDWRDPQRLVEAALPEVEFSLRSSNGPQRRAFTDLALRQTGGILHIPNRT